MGPREQGRRLVTAVQVAIVAVASACDRAPVDPVPTGTVTLPAEITLEQGEHRRLPLEYRDASGQAVPTTAQWTSSDEGIASVDTTGLVRGRNPGVAIIVARANGAADTTRVTVRALPFGFFLRLRPDTAEIIAGTRFPLFAHGPGVGARSRDWRPGELRWTSGDTAVARVDTLGVVEGVAPGVVDITVAGGGRADTLRLTVRHRRRRRRLLLGVEPHGSAGDRERGPLAAGAHPRRRAGSTG